MTITAARDTPGISRTKWLMISFAFIATVLNYLDRLAFTYLTSSGPLRKLIPDDAFGYIATAFFVAYMLSNAVSGFVIDKVGTRIGYSLSMTFWTTAGILHAFAVAPFQFGVLRFLLGVGEAGNWPAAIKLTREWFPPHQRSIATGIFNSGGAVGAIIAPPLIAWLGTSYGWKATFIIIGSLGYVWLLLFWFFYHTPGKSKLLHKPKTIPVGKLLRTRFVACLFISKIFIDPVWYFITFWIGRYLADVYHMSLAWIGSFAMIPFIVADIGNIVGGLFTAYIIKRGMPLPKARKVAAALFGGIMILSLLIGPFVIHSAATGLVILAGAGFGYAAYTANSMVFPSDVVPPHATASVWGIASVGAGLGGAMFQSISGVTVKSISQSGNYLLAYNTVFIGYGIVAAIGLSIVLFLMGPIDKDMKLDKLNQQLNPEIEETIQPGSAVVEKA
jgi:MFS transporter, ACS family, hexuronate transporter